MDKLQEYMTLKSQSDFLFVVFYRGNWCPFCMSYLKSLQSLTPSITAANGTPLTISAEPASNVEKSRAASGYTGPAISDPDNFIASKMRERGSVDVAITTKSGYPHGLAQPAILVIQKDGTVLFSWAIEPKTMNLGGATGRPVLGEVFENTMAKLQGQPQCQEFQPRQTSIVALLKEKIFG